MKGYQGKAEIADYSRSPQGDELISVLVTFPRIILAEINTHRMLSKNTSSSRAIPFFKMVKTVLENPFIPMGFQKHHSGMQGKEYLDPNKKITWNEIFPFIQKEIQKHFYNEDTRDWDNEWLELDHALNSIMIPLFINHQSDGFTPAEWWLKVRDIIVAGAVLNYSMGITKQLCNRLLEPFMWTTMLITGSKSAWNNFFVLRCPNYIVHDNDEEYIFYSKQDITDRFTASEMVEFDTGAKPLGELTDEDWLNLNYGAAEIHMMRTAEQIYDAIMNGHCNNLVAGEWHIPFKKVLEPLYDDYVKDKLLPQALSEQYKHKHEFMARAGVALAARTSYTLVGDETNLDGEKLIELYHKLNDQDPPHSSPFEHCAIAMYDEEYYGFVKGEIGALKDDYGILNREYYPVVTNAGVARFHGINPANTDKFGWVYNLKGFKSLRYINDQDRE
jgi:hypothetical protein